ncbi:MAG TPA: phosphotransferase [Fluviicoccus sp.]|nr:phosphotransferase [Fluviicoccus sp.]
MEDCAIAVDPRRDALYAWSAGWVRTHTPFTPAAALDIVSGDASFRRYFRLQHGQGSLICVDAPPDKENSRPFVAIARALFAHQVHVPEVLAVDFEQGFMLLSDLGDTLLRPCLNDDSVDELYGQAMDELLHLLTSPQPNDYPLPPYDHARLMTEMSLFRDWFLGRYLALELTAEETVLVDGVCDRIAHAVLAQPIVFVHRDYHSRNLMVLPTGRLGVIDFQDAVTGPITYDLVSLLRDAYVEWPSDRVNGWVEAFRRKLLAAGQITAEVDTAAFQAWFDWMGAQRHLKVLGIFARLSLRDGKHSYLNDIPLVFKYLVDEIGLYPELAAFREWVLARVVPAYLAKNPAAQPWLAHVAGSAA